MRRRGEVRAQAIGRLRAAGDPTAALDADLLLGHVLGIATEELYARPDVVVGARDEAALDALVTRRAAGEPVAYLRGWKEFHGLRLAVDPRVLVPRPETETLVEAVLAFAGGRPLTVVDVGTGSGAIAIAIVTRAPDLRVIATDVSAVALDVARENARRLGARVDFREGDLLGPVTEPVDVVAANLPYLTDDALERLTIERTSVAYEPRLATVAGADGLALIRRTVADLARVLASGGAAFFECDPPQVSAVSALLAPLGPVEVVRDLAGDDRVVGVRR